MCGIAGFIDKSNKYDIAEREDLLHRMLGLIEHRGGDSMGIKTIGSVTMGHTRLSILDADKRAYQPMASDNTVLSFNGEIYNHSKLRSQYCKSQKISSYSDTSTLFALLQTLSLKKVLALIHGMYAFSFLDMRNKSLSLILDKLAIKPLYYVDTPDFFAWASEIKAFKAIPGFKFKFRDDGLEEFMCFRYIVGEKTLFKNIYKMQAGEILTFSLKTNFFNKKIYYKLQKSKKQSGSSLSRLLKDSVYNHLMSDIPTGIQLSGGVDSSLVAYFAQKFSKKPLHTFSIGLKNNKWNEFIYSDMVAKLLKTNHHKITFSKRDFIRLFSKLTYHLDEPIVHPNTIPMYLLAKEARKYTKVLLTGEGADEVFYGYNRYFQKLLKSSKDILISNSFTDPKFVSSILKKFNPVFLKRLAIIKNVEGASIVNRVSYYDVYSYLPHVLLRQDKAGMVANIENRVPFLYDSVCEYGYNSKDKVGKYGGKNSIKKIALKYLPKDLVLRKKIGFGLPISNWLKDNSGFLPHLSNLKNHQIIKRYFIKSEINQLINEHVAEDNDHSSILFTLISLMTWYDIFINTSLPHKP
ncbi:MAG: asparagine synthase (glutamine-hydrolyzing) [Candidatus Zambryskibacteria bacterium RIFCSPHIGHO2_12_FULL_48_10]|uniref:asparagine synthase (glutamine-hydrolyzing) n=1 Tax=Candidatus Zambryskibacteria bacterium RIFCSPHIGHO2_01_FULL_46_25 TaxID=1802738 RepID=A0A1G2SYV5_9BACT|nr:MAG: Asparagine synthetase [Parcubacteria group bacterium GW2011_GWA1_47_10]OHA90226.1 MAG: asparagine synthase (glutamine-hydrolyzing) [Candidatus Zambryskibacteria bacterium RIFCSPHIGHO2_01_FULL_46_25]OHB02619.1 MAG: asparagine synthase (glutamine-hydrolyzing) [Candidatus Zambryskibacteria bacterium RIFCSPHIGHO2_12_FULL_48_10]OHB06763.1 MAG: asparagine synthase (glutamine-hydrolyzing) [Candidatus Zambryskibacteria bacterium RIFCSPLOWO2_01_FULL_48_25]